VLAEQRGDLFSVIPEEARIGVAKAAIPSECHLEQLWRIPKCLDFELVELVQPGLVGRRWVGRNHF